MNMFTEFWAPRDEIYAEPLCHDADTFWERLPANKVLVTVGGFEAFRDDVVAMANLMKKARGTEVELLVADGEIHVQPVVDRAIGEKDGRSMSKLLEWCQGL
jgi:acetyl esterase/lipase